MLKWILLFNDPLRNACSLVDSWIGLLEIVCTGYDSLFLMIPLEKWWLFDSRTPETHLICVFCEISQIQKDKKKIMH